MRRRLRLPVGEEYFRKMVVVVAEKSKWAGEVMVMVAVVMSSSKWEEEEMVMEVVVMSRCMVVMVLVPNVN